jgi:phosphotransferase system  glucose/maltose/N-acetylglucosamine-specific IIC component
MSNRIGALIAAVIAGLLGWAAATAFLALLLEAVLWGDLSWHYYARLTVVMVIPCAAVMLPSWFFVSLFAYARFRSKSPRDIRTARKLKDKRLGIG